MSPSLTHHLTHLTSFCLSPLTAGAPDSLDKHHIALYHPFLDPDSILYVVRSHNTPLAWRTLTQWHTYSAINTAPSRHLSHWTMVRNALEAIA